MLLLSSSSSLLLLLLLLFTFHVSLSLFRLIRYEIQAVRESLLSGEIENSTMLWKTTEKIFGWMDEIRRQIGVIYEEDM